MERAVSLPQASPVRRLIKRVLHVVIKAIILVTRAIKRYPIPALILLMALIGGYFALETMHVSLPFLGLNAAASTGGPRAADSFLRGQQEGNGSLIWNAVSDEMRADMQLQGQSPETIQRQLDQRRQQGLQYTNFRYVGGTMLEDDRSVHLYIVTGVERNQAREVPFTFTLDSAGKILKIE